MNKLRLNKYMTTVLLALVYSSVFSNINSTNKPWTYWWWLGSAVDSANITYNLENFEKAGIGGVHIIPIYGVKGFEEKFIDYLSPQWMEMLSHTADECERLGLGLDMTIGTGWPFGGPQVSSQHSSSQLIDLSFEVNQGAVNINLLKEAKMKYEKLGEFSIIAVKAFTNGKNYDIKDYVDAKGILDWKSNYDKCKIIALISVSSIQQVKRAAPGAKGNVVDPFSIDALNNYLSFFDISFDQYNGKMVRSFYHDSYEYYGADWSNNLVYEFEKRRGYNLLDVLPDFLNVEENEKTSRIKSDYRSTISELHEEFILHTTDWSNERGVLFRNQAHGSPTNLLDTYAAADIPECEVFGVPKLNIPEIVYDSRFTREEFVDPLILKFSSSAAHVSGKNLISSETGTWIAEHFRETLSQLKTEIDLLFYSGVNHIFFHGIPYSPKNEEWPGWLFYASTNYGPNNSLWYNLPAFNKYIERCQSILQEGRPDNELLIYFPVWDLWHTSKGKLIPFQVHQPEDWLFGTNFYNTSKLLFDNGFSFDYISDKQIQNLRIDKGDFLSNGNQYKAIVIPSCRFMPIKTLQKLFEFAKNGGKVFFLDTIPEDVPGFYNYNQRQLELKKIKKKFIDFDNILFGNNLIQTLSKNGIEREHLAEYKINFIRKKSKDGKNYFIVNQQPRPLNDWVRLTCSTETIIILDPLTGKTGKAKTRKEQNGKISVYLQLEPGSSLILKTLNEKVGENEWIYLEHMCRGFEISGKWEVDFINGGPVLPIDTTINKLRSWTEFVDNEGKRFAGTAKYSIKFENPDPSIKNWILDLGKVCESARIKLNNQDLGTLWSIPFRLSIDNLLIKDENELVIEVTNLYANRIRDLDIRGVNWKKFYDINFVNIHYRKFDASTWEIVDSGLIGPVMLYPARPIEL